MSTLVDWLPYAAVGVTFSMLGLMKVYGFRKGIVGGGDKPMSCRLYGRCPSWSKQLNIAMTVAFLGIGLVNLALLLMVLLES